MNHLGTALLAWLVLSPFGSLAAAQTAQVTIPTGTSRRLVCDDASRMADPKLEGQSAGRKLLLRMGPGNAARVKAKLTEIRGHIAAKP